MALLVATDTYEEPYINDLSRCILDARSFQAVLADPSRGAFNDLALAENFDASSIKAKIENFLATGERDDVVLLSISGHMSTLDGRLVVLAGDSSKQDLSSTTVSGNWLVEQLDKCRSKRVVLILDGCHAGIINESSKSLPDFDAANAAGLAGYGRVVIASTSPGREAYEYTLDDDRPTSFTDILTRGLVTGDADVDSDGIISAFELFEYSYNETIKHFVGQRPTLTMFGGTPASITVSYNPKAPHRGVTSHATIGLPPKIYGELTSSSEKERAEALWQLLALTESADVSQRKQALLTLFEMSQDPNERIRRFVHWRLTAGDRWWADDSFNTTESSQFPVGGPVDWAKVLKTMLKAEINVTGDLNFVNAGGDVKGNALGRKNKVKYREIISGQLGTADDVRKAVELLAEEVGDSDLAVKDKSVALTALLWWAEHFDDEEEPAEANEQTSALQRVGGWVWDHFKTFVEGIPPAVAGAWVFDVIQHIH